VKFTRQRYQLASLSREARKAGPSVWIFRWRENAAEGRVYRKVVVGTVEQFPTKTAAKHAVAKLRSTINADNAAVPMTVTQLVRHYEENELPKKAWSTQRTVETTFKIWVLPTWGEHKLVDVKTVQAESWLHGLSLANHTKAKIRNVMHIIFTHACRHEWLDKNPMTLVRQSAKRQKMPDVLELDELKMLLEELDNPARLLVFLTVATGLRISEALGLKWSDVDFSDGHILLRRAVVHQHEGDMKTEASQKPVPIDGALLHALQDWSGQTLYRQNDDWVFASPDKGGNQPYWPEILLKCHVQPAAIRLGITKQIGWHSFRRTFATLLGGSEDVKTMQGLMRHANSRLTLDLYAQALTPAKRAAHRRLVGLIEGPGERQLVPCGPTHKESMPVSA
jgi:integrase